MDFSFFDKPFASLDDDEIHGWIYSNHFQICELVDKNGYKSLNSSEQLNYLVGYLYFQVSNGGLWQYFFNPCGPDAPKLLDSLIDIGATQSANIIREALTYFPNSVPPEDMAERANLIDRIPEQKKSELDQKITGFLMGDSDQEDVMRLLGARIFQPRAV